MFKQLDIYIFRKFIGTFVFALMLFTMVAIVIDLVEKLDDLIEKQVPITELILDYYINFGGELDDMNWRQLKPLQFFKKVEEQLTKRLN